MQNHHCSEIVDASIFPNDLDILCGSGKVVSAHPGNQRFQAIVNKHYASFAAALSKRTKVEVTRDLMAEIMSSGCTRFLKKDPIYQRYYVAPSTRVGKDKVAHSLREIKMARARQDRRRQSPLRGDQSNSSGDSSSKSTHSNEEPKLQQGFSFSDYTTMQQPSMGNILHGGLKMTMLVPETIASHANSSLPTTDMLRFGTSLSGTTSSTSDTTVLAPAAISRASVPFEAAAPQRWWPRSGPFFSCRPTSQQGPPAESLLCNMEHYIPATSLVDPVRGIFSSLFPPEQEQHQQVVQYDLTFNMLPQDQYCCMLASDNNDDDIYSSILDTLRRGHHQEQEASKQSAGCFPLHNVESEDVPFLFEFTTGFEVDGEPTTQVRT